VELTQSFQSLVSAFQCVFTTPTFSTFSTLVTGWILSPQRHRFVTELIQAAGAVGQGHHSRFHRFFSHAAWSLDELFRRLFLLLVCSLVPEGMIQLAVDDTLCRKRGLTLHGAGMHYDPLISSRVKSLVSWGHDWVVVCLILKNPFWSPTKSWAVPIACRLYRNRQGLTKGKGKSGAKSKTQKKTKAKASPDHRTRPELAVELLELIASWLPDRQFLVTGDSAYGGKSVVTKLPSNMHLISRVHPQGRMYAPPPPPVKSKTGRPRLKGERLSNREEWSKDPQAPWTPLKFDQFGLHAQLEVKVRQALYYASGRNRLLTIVLMRDTTGERPEQMFFCTDLTLSAKEILGTYACRWSIEVTFENTKQLLGLEDPANRLPRAVERTAPMALFLYSLSVLWFHQEGHRHVQFPYRPWYRQKREPSYADILATLRRRTWTDILWGGQFKPPLTNTELTQFADFLCRAA
jgi:SRSO17 transposase